MKKKKRFPTVEAGVVFCHKKEIKGRVIIQAATDPSLKAKADSLSEAEEILLNEIWSRYELDEPVAFKYETAILETSLLTLAPNVVADSTNPERYFKNGFCSTCQSGKGGRNPERLHIDSGVRGAPGLIVRFQPFIKCGLRVGMDIFQEEICEVLRGVGQPLIEFRQVMQKNTVTTFREMVSTSVLQCVIPKSKKDRAGGICTECGATFIFGDSKQLFLRNSDVALVRKQGAAMIGSDSAPTLCVTGKVWKAIEGSRLGLKLLVHRHVSGLDESEILETPKYEKIVPLTLK